MRPKTGWIAALYVITIAFLSVPNAVPQTGDGTDASVVGILVVSKTPGYRHKSIPAGNEAMKRIGRKIEQRSDVERVNVDIVDSKGKYKDTKPVNFPSDPTVLKNKYDVLVFNNSNDANPPDSEDVLVLNEAQQNAFEEFIRTGGGFVGIHSAVDNMTADSFYSRVLGAYYEQHAKFQKGTLKVPDRVHPSTNRLPVEWKTKSEWYTFQENPRGDVHVLVAADESTYDGKGMNGEGHLHPVSWCQNIAGGKSWYTALGHSPGQFKNDRVLNHIMGGITWAAGVTQGEASGTVWKAYRKTPLDTNTESPAALDVAPDGRVFYVDRRDYNNDETDDVMVIDPEGNRTKTVLELPVSRARIYGLKDLLLDPEFESNGWMYLFYVAPEEVSKEEGSNARVSRFKVTEGTISRKSEQVLLSFHVDSQLRGHLGGNMDWGPDGKQLYVSVGDDTQIATGYTPIDEREGRELYDAQRTSGNTADLRGSILRIIPRKVGSYNIPDDNLFTSETGYASEIKQGTVRPEIYAMGMRNPYRITVDPETGVLYWADYGPDAGGWNQKRGPLGMVEYNRTDEAGFFGWPYFVGNNIPYRDYDFDSGNSGDLFRPSSPVNDSPNNTGLKKLPAAKGTMITSPKSWEEYLDYPSAWNRYVPYEDMDDVPFPQVQGGAPMQGPVYRHGETSGAQTLPEYYEGKVFIMERGRNWVKYVTLDESGSPVAVEPFLPDETFRRPTDMEVGPDGALYLAEWGSGYEGPNDDSGIYRIRHRPQVASLRFPDASGNPVFLNEGQELTLTATVTNRRSNPIPSGHVTLRSGEESLLGITPDQATFEQLGPGQSTRVSWTVTASGKAGGRTIPLTAELRYRSAESGETVSVNEKITVQLISELTVPFGVNLGGDAPMTIEGVRFVPASHPGVRPSDNASVSGTDEAISGTEHDKLYQTLQYANNLSYEISLPDGTYDVTLHFLENHFNNAGKRVFSVAMEDEVVLDRLDIYKEVGHDVALSKTIKNVRVQDRSLSITTDTHTNLSSISGIEVHPAGKQTAAKGEPESGSVDKTVVIEADDQMTYDIEEFTVSPGSTVELTLKHTGNLPKPAMGHNVVILNDVDQNPVSFAREASGQGTLENDYLPKKVHDRVLAATDMIGGGETDTIQFRAPEEPGAYPYLCSFPQHAASMNGDMVVKEK